MFSNQKILVIGGAGFVGSNLCHRLLGENPDQIVVTCKKYAFLYQDQLHQ